MRKNKNKNIIIIAVLIAISVMSVGYSIFTTQLTFDGTAEIIGEWNVKIVDIQTQSVSEGCDPGIPQYTNTSVTFYSKLVKPGDSISYAVTIKNAGTIDATLSQILFKEQDDGSPAINYITTELDHLLKAGEQTTMIVTVEYISGYTEVPSVKTKTLTGIIEYVQK